MLESLIVLFSLTINRERMSETNVAILKLQSFLGVYLQAKKNYIIHKILLETSKKSTEILLGKILQFDCVSVYIIKSLFLLVLIGLKCLDLLF